jgi:hypothetical protein
MQHQRKFLLPLLIAPALVAFASVAAQTIAYAPVEGSRLTKTFSSSSDVALDDMSMVVNGQEMDAGTIGLEMAVTSKITITVTDEYTKVADGQLARFVRTFDELSSTTQVDVSNQMMGDMDGEIAGASELEGLKVVFTHDGDSDGYAIAWAEDSGGDDELLEDLDWNMDLADFLPGKDVAEGDTWSIPAKALRAVFAPGGSLKIEPEDMDEELMGMGAQPPPDQALGEFEGQVTGEFRGVRDVDGTKVAVIHVTADVTAAKDLTELTQEMIAEQPSPEGMDLEMNVESSDMEFAFEGEGELLWNVTTGLLHSFEISGETAVTTDTSMSMSMAGNAQDVEQSMSLSGNQSISVKTGNGA